MENNHIFWFLIFFFFVLIIAGIMYDIPVLYVFLAVTLLF